MKLVMVKSNFQVLLNMVGLGIPKKFALLAQQTEAIHNSHRLRATASLSILY